MCYFVRAATLKVRTGSADSEAMLIKGTPGTNPANECNDPKAGKRFSSVTAAWAGDAEDFTAQLCSLQVSLHHANAANGVLVPRQERLN